MKVKFSGEFEVPDGTPYEDIDKWLKFELGEIQMLEADNAMAYTDIMSVGCKNVWTD